MSCALDVRVMLATEALQQNTNAPPQMLTGWLLYITALANEISVADFLGNLQLFPENCCSALSLRCGWCFLFGLEIALKKFKKLCEYCFVF